MRRGWVPGGRLSALRTMREMAANVRSSRAQPLVWETAKRIVAGVPERDEIGQAMAIRRWVDTHLVFVKDPLGVELLETPSYLLGKIRDHGFVQGDCDDAASLTAALGTAIGLPAKFVAVGFGPDQPFSHVFTVLYPINVERKARAVVEMDVTRPVDRPFMRRFPKQISVTV